MSREVLGWTLLAASYLLGAIPFGLLLGKQVAGVDVRQAGSGNIGATNVARTAGKGLGVLTLLLDAAKGAVAVVATALLMDERTDGAWATAAGLAAFLGHVFPPWLRFRGGKGVATAFGIFLVLDPRVGLLAAAVFGLAFLATRTVSLASLAASLAVAGSAAVLRGGDDTVARVAAVVMLVVIVRHQSNIRRILRGEESRVRRRPPGAGAR
ncbi:MAG TPA: glycerol-3-phosphate 1-O-acyltransferase PlsY [Anaeromyxobacteraceae bacterium]|nr:glycerol-3-phosphate 1-O-acyltransferase PlsY [Anaeromyxobacteraceae bacterium]